MTKRLLLLGACAGAIAIAFGSYSVVSYARKFNYSYALAPNPLAGEAINRCYPTTYFPPEEVRFVDSKGSRYYEAVARPRQETANDYQSLYIQTKGNACKWLNREDLSSGRLEFTPEQVAVALAKQNYARYLEQCVDIAPQAKDAQADCIEQLEATINVSTNRQAQQTDFLFPDDAKALNELGIKTDKVLVVESIADLESRSSHRPSLKSGPDFSISNPTQP